MCWSRARVEFDLTTHKPQDETRQQIKLAVRAASRKLYTHTHTPSQYTRTPIL